MDPGWIAALTALSAAVLTASGWAARFAWRTTRRVVHFLDDYAGQPACDGRPAVPGFMARLGSVEQVANGIIAEMRPNGGQSLRDVVHRTASDVADIKADQAELRVRVEIMQHRKD